MAKGRKTFTDAKGKTVHTTKWQELVSQYGIKGAKKHYAGYRQRPVPPTTTGHVRNVKGGTRRVKGNKVGSGKRSTLYYKGDKVGTWAKSRGNTTQGRTGLGWYQERGYGTARKPVPDTKLSQRLGIAGKGKEGKGKMLTPGAVAGLNEEEEWEIESHKRAGKAVAEAEFESPLADTEVFGPYVNDNVIGQDYAGQVIGQDAEAYDAELTMWQKAVQKHGIPPKPRSKGHGHGAFKAYRGRKQKDGVMYSYGDKTSKWTPSGGYTTKDVNTGRGWFMERGYGTPRKPVPVTPLTKRLGIAGSGRQTRGPGGLFSRMKKMLVPSVSGINQQQDWEIEYAERRGLPFFEAEGGSCPNCGFHSQ